MLDLIRTARQHQIGDKWKANGAKGSLQAVTGFGKTNVAMLLIEDMNLRYPDRTTLVVVPTIVLKEQWEVEIKERKIKHVEVLVINTAIKHLKIVNLLVLDELHRYAAETFKNVFKVIQYDFILGLTATLSRSDGKHELLKTFCPLIDTVSMAEARKNGWVSEYVVFALGITLPPEELAAYTRVNKKFGRYFGMFGHDFKKAMACLSDPNVRHQVALENNWEPREVHVNAIQFSRAMHERKKFVNEHHMKLWYGKQISDKFPKANMLVFAETTDFADQLAIMIGDKCAPFHSKIKKKERTATLKSFKDRRTKLKILSTARALDEGFNVEGIDFAVICSGNSTARQAIQRIGRSIRFKEGKQAHIVNLYLKDTQDEKWTRKRLASIPNVVWIDTLEEIDYEVFEERSEEAVPDGVSFANISGGDSTNEAVYSFGNTSPPTDT